MEILGSYFRVDVNAHVLAIGLFNPGSERTQIGNKLDLTEIILCETFGDKKIGGIFR
jgi:hypothetical protein